MSQYEILKYPRTPHLEGSHLQSGDEDLSQIPFSCISDKKIVVEEKCDGANTAVSFDGYGNLLLQSRGHYLMGGSREKHYNLMKQWVGLHRDAFHIVLGSRYIMYGEWLYAKHTVFYNCLPHYFLEFDIYDRETEIFLDTPSRHALLADLPIVSVPVLKHGAFKRLSELTALIGQSRFITEGHIEWLREYCERNGGNAEKRCGETDPTTLLEGLYIKIEQDGKVVDRIKFVRASFLQCAALSDSNWLSRPIVPNQLSYPLEGIFAPKLSEI